MIYIVGAIVLLVLILLFGALGDSDVGGCVGCLLILVIIAIAIFLLWRFKLLGFALKAVEAVWNVVSRMLQFVTRRVLLYWYKDEETGQDALLFSPFDEVIG
ncbi:hypothetical protein B0I26_10427 [Anoxybacillus vitaminiphilus]|uniref:Uncharacterized protein n=1 Tax=Paranoxybacillus vitaminiphilus TaxID=581036 RepID=A0A327YJJ4_9BACL|nr:hypothetical protein [Anoxybacillus vitaminiphilus]RAK20376.1 hypothetical protein B0I26_10427 [Anoxybacillus vitaminiphilus]